MRGKYRILAGTSAQARVLADEMKLDRMEWEFVPSEACIMGLREEVLLCYGTWGSRKDAPEILTRARIQRMNILHIS